MVVAVYMQVARFFPPEIIQRTAINKWLYEHKIAHSSVQWFVDREDKTEFFQLSRDIERGAVRTVVLHSLEQAFTSINSITEAIGNFASKDITFVSVSQNIWFDPVSIKSAHSLLTVVFGLAEHHRRVRQKIGIEKAQAKGLYKGKKPGATKPAVDIKKALRWKARGWSAKRIAKKLGVSESSVFKYLRLSRKAKSDTVSQNHAECPNTK